MAGRGLVMAVAFAAAAYGWFIEWSVKLLLLGIIAAFL
jgi:hypothetical protein